MASIAAAIADRRLSFSTSVIAEHMGNPSSLTMHDASKLPDSTVSCSTRVSFICLLRPSFIDEPPFPERGGTRLVFWIYFGSVLDKACKRLKGYLHSIQEVRKFVRPSQIPFGFWKSLEYQELMRVRYHEPSSRRRVN
jgi:hypothetical protein